MTLTQYLSQETPVQDPYVKLQDNEYEVLEEYRRENQLHRIIRIPALKNHYKGLISGEYIAVGDWPILHVPSTMETSCFYLPTKR